MSRVYDLWEKLVGAVFDREELRRLALSDSFSSSSFSEYSSRFSFGEGVMCQAFRAWIDEHALIASKPGSGMAVTVKKWSNFMERHQDWL
ncbi:non-specific serine/threonine protein kinase [Salvia divinorum]|uniref:Non-specific serine/threonine protein kinase n=1 Tax=Salvia divinorum TaxID=28513 RepID=A0ABD1GPJ8_SALDI